jgi:hypothetical protein
MLFALLSNRGDCAWDQKSSVEGQRIINHQTVRLSHWRRAMATQVIYPMTRQGVRNLDNPIHVQQSKGVAHTKQSLLVPLGGLLAGYGLGRRDLAGLILAAVSSGLICSGFRAH